MQGFLGKFSDKGTAKISYAMSQQPPSIRRNRNAVRELWSRELKEEWPEKGSRKENG